MRKQIIASIVLIITILITIIIGLCLKEPEVKIVKEIEYVPVILKEVVYVEKEPEPEVIEEPVTNNNIDEELLRDFAALVYLEAGSCSKECQLAIASVILNRMNTRNSTFYEIAYAPNQFSPADRIKSTTPSELSLECARYVLENGPTIDEYVCFFRNCFYFDWVEPYMNIDNVYFSYDYRVKEAMCNG